MPNRKFREARPLLFFILLIFFALNLPAAQAGAPFVETGSIGSKVNLVPYAEYLPDPDGSLELEDIFSSRHHEKFLPLANGIPLNETGALWLRFTLAPAKGPADADSLFLDLGKRIPEGSVVYTPRDVGPVSAGPSVWNLRRATPDGMFKIPPASPNGPTSVYTRIPATPDIWFAPVLLPVTRAGEMGNGIIYYLSIGLLGFLVALCLLRAFRDSGEWRLWTAVLAAMILAQQLLQIPALPLGFSYYAAALLYLLVPALGLALMPHVARHLWNTPSSCKRLDKVLSALSIAGGMLPLCILIPGLAWTARLLPLWPVLAIFCCLAAVPAIKGRLPGAGRYFLSMLLLSAGGALTLLAQTTNNPNGILLNAPVWTAGIAALLLGVLPMRSLVEHEEISSPLSENQDDSVLLLSDVLDVGSIPDTDALPETTQHPDAEDVLLKALSGESRKETGEDISLNIPADNAAESQNQFPQTEPEQAKEETKYSPPLSMQAAASIQPLPSDFFVEEDAFSLVSAPRPLSIRETGNEDEEKEPAEAPTLTLTPADKATEQIFTGVNEAADVESAKEAAPSPTMPAQHSGGAELGESGLTQNSDMDKPAETESAQEKQEAEIDEPEARVSESALHELSEAETLPVNEPEQAGTELSILEETLELQTSESELARAAPPEDAAAGAITEESDVQNWSSENPDAEEQSSLIPHQSEDSSDVNQPCLQATDELNQADESADAVVSSATAPETAQKSHEAPQYSANNPAAMEDAPESPLSQQEYSSSGASESASPALAPETEDSLAPSDSSADSDEAALSNAAEKLMLDALPVLKIPLSPEQDTPEENDDLVRSVSETAPCSELEKDIGEAEQTRLHTDEACSASETKKPAESSEARPDGSPAPGKTGNDALPAMPSIPAEVPLNLNSRKQPAGHSLQIPDESPEPEPQLKPGFFSRFRQSGQRRPETPSPSARLEEGLYVSDRPGGTSTRPDPLVLSKIEETLKVPLESLMQAVSELNNCSLPPLARVQAEAINKAGKALADIVGSLGQEQMQEEAAGPQSADKAAQESIFDLQVVLREAHAAVATKAERRGLALSWFMPPHLPLLYKGNPAQLQDVLRLLLDSAIESTDKGSVQVTVRRLPDSTNPGHLVFSVTDAGETSPHMRRSTTALMKAWEMVVEQGGTLSLDSTPNQGTVVSFTLHLSVPGKQLEHLFSLSGDEGQMRPLSILIAVEQATNRQLIAFFLNDLPYLIEEARSADEALSRYMENPAGIILFDEALPGLNLQDAISRLHEIDASQNIPPVPVLTLTESQAGEEQALAAGSRAVIGKPLSRSRVRDAVKTLLPVPAEVLEALKPAGIPLAAPNQARAGEEVDTAPVSDTVSPVQDHTDSEVSFINSGNIAEITPEPLDIVKAEPEQPKVSVSRSLANLAKRFIKIRKEPQPPLALEAETLQKRPDAEGEQVQLKEESGVSETLSADAAAAPEPEASEVTAPAASSSLPGVSEETLPNGDGTSPSAPSLEVEEEESSADVPEPAACPPDPVNSGLDAATPEFSSSGPMPEPEPSFRSSSEEPEAEKQEDKMPAEPEALPAKPNPETEEETPDSQEAESAQAGASDSQESVETASPEEIPSVEINAEAEWDAGLPITVEGDEVDPEVVHLIPGLLDNLEHALADARLGLENRSFLGVSEACMRIAGTADAHGLRTLKNIANCVERAANANDMEAVSDLLNELGESIDSTRNSLEAVYREYTGSSSV